MSSFIFYKNKTSYLKAKHTYPNFIKTQFINIRNSFYLYYVQIRTNSCIVTLLPHHNLLITDVPNLFLFRDSYYSILVIKDHNLCMMKNRSCTNHTQDQCQISLTKQSITFTGNPWINVIESIASWFIFFHRLFLSYDINFMVW